MCVAVPARIVWIGEASPASIPARVDVAGREQPVDLVLVPAAALGEHVVVHSGYAVRRLSPSDAAAASRTRTAMPARSSTTPVRKISPAV